MIITEPPCTKTFDRHANLMLEEATQSLLYLRKHPNPNTALIFTDAALVARKIGCMIYDAPKLWTGYASVQAIQRKLDDFSYRASNEHYYSRQKGGNALCAFIVDHFYNCTTPTLDQIKQIMNTYCKVHYTTAEENASLAAFQRNHEHEEAYKLASVHLVEAIDLFTKRGHSIIWKQDMVTKYSPIIDNILNVSCSTMQPKLQ